MTKRDIPALTNREASRYDSVTMAVPHCETLSDARPAGMPSNYATTGKRILDVSLSAAGLLLAAPIIVVTALLIRARLGSPVVFAQMRPGLGGQPIVVYKFRSMNDARGASGALLPDEARLTVLGKWLRKLSLDELPQLWNVLRGDMSPVGPRPLLMEYLPLYNAQQARRHEVRPGITGWAQVKGRNALSWDEKFALDVWYVDHVSFRVDLKIIALTVWQLVRPQGISQPGSATMPRFTGNVRDD